MDHYKKDLDKKIILSFKFSAPPIFIIYNNSGKENEEDENNE